MEEKSQRAFEKVAGLLLQGVPQHDIARIMQLTDGRISQIKDDVRFQAIYEALKRSNNEDSESHPADEMLDKIELKALGLIDKRLTWPGPKDHHFALQVAAFANKSYKRTAPVLQGRIGDRVGLSLNAVYINKLQMNGNGNGKEVIETKTIDAKFEEKKKIDILQPERVERLLNNKETVQAEAPNMHEIMASISKEFDSMERLDLEEENAIPS